jgi:hypothetical protein
MKLSDRVAISGEWYPAFLKQRLLFFDRIGILNLAMYSNGSVFNTGIGQGLANELEFLLKRNVIFDALPYVPRYEEGEQIPPEDTSDSFAFSLVNSAIQEELNNLGGNQELDEYLVMLESTLQLRARLCAREIQRSRRIETSALISGPLIVPKGMKDLFRLPLANITEVVLSKIPMPSELTPWEAIFDFKSDEEAQGYLQGLKVWMSDLARQKLTATEASEKLDWLLFQHKKHLEMHKLSYRWGTLGGTFVAAAEILEDLAKIKWGKAAGAVVSIFDKRVELMKAELSNPAKEVSYIVKAQEQFGE